MLKIKEQLSPTLKKALFRNFSNAHEALLEIIDNSVSQRWQGRPLRINIDLVKKTGHFWDKNQYKLVIKDSGGRGMDLQDLKFFFNWGGERKRESHDIGEFGQGGKAAIGFLGSACEIKTSKDGDATVYHIIDEDLWDFGAEKEYPVMTSSTTNREGFTEIAIDNLRFSVTPNFKKKLKSKIINTYKQLIENGSVVIYLDREKLNPEPLPLDPTKRKENFKILIDSTEFRSAMRSHKSKRKAGVYRINLDEHHPPIVEGWVGRLSPRSHIKGGMRCYYKGRLICDGEFFGHPDPRSKATVNYLIGEVSLDFVPVNTNKTNFDRSSLAWVAVEKRMYEVLEPHIKELLKQRVEEPTAEDVENVKNAQQLCNKILEMMHKEEKGQALSGEAFGQKPPEPRGVPALSLEAKVKRNPYKPASPPPKNSVGKRKRLKQFMEWDIRPMGRNIRSKIEEGQEGKVLVINNIFPGYKAAKGNEIYLLETAALQMVDIEEDKLSKDEFLDFFDEFFAEMCSYIDEAKQALQETRRKR